MVTDETRLNGFMGKFGQNLDAVIHAATRVVGDRLGFYKALAKGLCPTQTPFNLIFEARP
jgi:hypothetical protein